MRLRRPIVIGIALLAMLGLDSSSALAKSKVKTATFNQCLSTASPLQSRRSATASLNVPVPKNGKKPQGGVVTAVSGVGVRISYPDDGQLIFSLISPGGRAVVLSVERGLAGDGYGTGAANCGGSLVQFGDAFTTPIESPGNAGDDPVTGGFRPAQPLAGFAGSQARGPWTLLVQACCDNTQAGSLDAFSLNLTYQYRAQAKAKKK
jgi:subtilisin-like proprotein convertase family protein